MKRILTQPRVNVIVEGEREIHMSSSFWEMTESVTTRINELSPEADKLVATVALDLPSFEDRKRLEARGTISYAIEETNFQSPVASFQLRFDDLGEKNFSLSLRSDFERSILAIRAVSVERELSISMEKAGTVARFFKFLDEKAFKNPLEDFPDVYICKSNEFFRYCILEILTINDAEALVRISARMLSLVDIIERLLRESLSDVEVTDMEERTKEAARALERELELELSGVDVNALNRARTITDLLIP